jgi:DNA-3-methyladenine glycosylase II
VDGAGLHDVRLRRLDIWPTADLAIRRGYGLAWGLPTPTARQLEPLGDPFRPYRTVLSLYRWRASELYGHGGADFA